MRAYALSLLCLVSCQVASEATQSKTEELSLSAPTPGPNGWGAGDEKGNGNTQSYATRIRCAIHLANPRSRVYELSYPFSATMPQSPFGDAPVSLQYHPTAGLPFTRHVDNGEIFSGGIGSQGTQFDAIGHFGYLDSPWLGPASGPLPVDQAHYYNGFTQSDVKPTPSSPLLKLGVDKSVPIVTSAVMLDVVKLRGRQMTAGELVSLDDINKALSQEGLAQRGILPGDAVFIHTGWGDKWTDPAPNPNVTDYYKEGPGLSVEAQNFFASRTIVLIALDNPFTDPLRACQLTGECGQPAGTAQGLPFNVHHNDLTRDGIHQIQNLKLDEMAADQTYSACAIVLPLRITGGAGSAVRPIAIGAPWL